MQHIVLRPIIRCTTEQLNAVREIRNQESVRKSMYTEHEIGLDEHIAWVERLSVDDRQMVFVILSDDVVMGVISVNAIDRLHKKSDWAFYLDQRARGGLGAALEFSFINFVFDDLGLKKLNCEVIETNSSVVKLHKKFSFVEEGFRRSNIDKNGKRIGVYLLGLTCEDWREAKSRVMDVYQSVFSKFTIDIERS